MSAQATVPPDLGEARRLIEFIDAAPSPFHACAQAAARLEEAGFTQVAEIDAWPGPGRHFVIRGGTLVAWAVPADARPTTAFRIVGAHTDSPNLRVKPQPDGGRAGLRQLGVEVYGGVLLNSWLGRDLGLSGRVLVRSGDGAPEARLVKIDRPLLHLPQLAIHLDDEVKSSGLKLNPQDHLAPVWGIGDRDEGGLRRFLAKELGADEDDVVGWDVMAHDLTPGSLLGRQDEFLASGRLDNLCCAFAAVRAAGAASAPDDGAAIPVICLFDHEEVGSESVSGAGSPILATVLERLVLGRGGDRDAFHRSLAGSVCVSADMAHATHPNYTDRHEPDHWIEIDGGPVIKYNASQRYATDAATASVFVDACARAGVPVQRYVHRNDLRCGSTIGPITAARLGVPVVDVGAPQLAMHSARELMGSVDPGYLVAALTAFLSG